MKEKRKWDMKKALKKIDSFVLALGEAAVGILLLINPVGFTVAIIVGIGFLLALMGVLSVLAYFRTEPEEAAK